MIYGNITKDPELKALPSGLKVCNLSVATNRTWKNKDGEKQEQADFHSVIAFGKTADLIDQYMRKGSSIYIEGRIQTRSWDDEKSGQKRYKTEIVAESIQFGPKKTVSENKVDSGDKLESLVDDISPDEVPF